MYLIYYSHAKNTHRFVERHLAKAIATQLEAINEGETLNVWRLLSTGPHMPITSVETMHYSLRENMLHSSELTHPGGLRLPYGHDVVYVTPTYGQFNHQLHRAENYTPDPIAEAFSWFHHRDPSPENPSQAFMIIGGNRTFGKDFAVQDVILPEAKWLGMFELSGSETDAELFAKGYKQLKEETEK